MTVDVWGLSWTSPGLVIWTSAAIFPSHNFTIFSLQPFPHLFLKPLLFLAFCLFVFPQILLHFDLFNVLLRAVRRGSSDVLERSSLCLLLVVFFVKTGSEWMWRTVSERWLNKSKELWSGLNESGLCLWPQLNLDLLRLYHRHGFKTALATVCSASVAVCDTCTCFGLVFSSVYSSQTTGFHPGFIHEKHALTF